MRNAIQAVDWLEAVAFSVLAVITLIEWIRYRGRQRQYLAWAIGLLALITLSSRFAGDTGVQPRWLEVLTVPVFLGSGYALLLVRHSFIPLRRRTLLALGALVVAVSAVLVAIPPPANSQNVQNASGLYVAAALGFILLWCAFILEPVIRFWMASRGKPLVQRARLRALSLGYGSIIAVIIVAIGIALGAGLQSSAQGQPLQLAIGIVVLFIIPLLYVSFVPPGWLRRFWRAREEAALRTATSELLTEEDPGELAHLALAWALRLSGAEAGLIASRSGEVLAAEHLETDVLRRLRTLDPGTTSRLVQIESRGEVLFAIVAPLRARESNGIVAVIAGPFTPVFGADEVDRLGGYGIDVGAALERVDMVRQLGRRAFELERSNEALQEFAYVASHDLQEPLRMVASYLQLLRSRYGGKLDDDADEFIEFAVDGAKRMQSLINDLLEYSRIGTRTAPMQPTNLAEVLQLTQANLRTTIDEAGARIIVGQMPTVVADPGQLLQLTQNLIANAIKFRGDAAPVIHIGATRGAREWEISVRDNGIGLEPRHSERIFQIFKRLHPPNEYPGTGIGLAISRKIVERHGGRIWVDSKPGEGATFRFTLPDSPPVQGHEGAEPPPATVLAVPEPVAAGRSAA
ncbi:MAG TPA: ATP-binding protein [Candidatus Dormibacteraeota bacterium]